MLNKREIWHRGADLRSVRSPVLNKREIWHREADLRSVRFPVLNLTFIGAMCHPCGVKNPFLTIE